MKKILCSTLVVIFFVTFSHAQQDPMFTKYMFNTLIYNPAFAGTKDHLSIGLLHRTQWVKLDGAPTTQTLTIHTPLKGKRVAVGGSLLHDDIGISKEVKLNGYYAYHINFKGNSKLSVGVSGGVSNWQADFGDLEIDNPNDPSLMGNMQKFLPIVGAGAFYYNDLFYIGFSTPNILPNDLPSINTIFNARQYGHYYLGGGLMLPLSSTLVFKPSFLIKNSNLYGAFGNNNVGAPTEFDIDVSLLFYDALWVGMSFRSAFEGFNSTSSVDSADAWLAYYLRNGFRVGVAFDYTLTPLQKVSVGSFEMVLGYEFDYKESAIMTPRYFF
jgi:type IX secretion system PorP/SprF family membrane protein